MLVVEDDAMVGDWLRHALEGSEFRLAGVARSAELATDLIGRRRPQLLLVDQRLPDGVGTELVRALRREGVAIPAVMMTANPEDGFNETARAAGAQGSILKSGRIEELVATMRAVVSGKPAFDSRHPQRPPGRGTLSPREREVLGLIAKGETNHQIAERLGIGDETVKTLIARVFAKLGVRKRAEAVSEAHNRGLL